ncbi:hypothetical protein [Microbacterium oleivorans]|uniref:Uncharacterized protein n=1 Tax=Microbacterium oleivorans TaxID=273677 RepID=A0A7D5F7W8_9MICO|nr:hypothetical protein [Microbacterium oleivorans]QLD11209.1 hypothetical protein HW566_05115 [Microbacterium oleivorans]
MATVQQQVVAPATGVLSFGAHDPVAAVAVHYETIALVRGPGAVAAVGTPFADAHTHHGDTGSRLVSGYLGLEAPAGADVVHVTSHGRVVASVVARDATTLVIERTGDATWKQGGFAVVGTELGSLHPEADRDVVVGENVVVYLVHGPAPEKVLARTADLRVRARLDGRPMPAGPA